jgi:predicted enzyme related to lactoylglutathione lyase
VLAHPHRGIDHVEFTVTDMAAAQRFHAQAVDWKFDDDDPRRRRYPPW